MLHASFHAAIDMLRLTHEEGPDTGIFVAVVRRVGDALDIKVVADLAGEQDGIAVADRVLANALAAMEPHRAEPRTATRILAIRQAREILGMAERWSPGGSN